MAEMAGSSTGTAASRPGSADAAARSDETPHAFLRRVTRPWHDGVESAFEHFDLQTIDGLSGFLLRQAAALIPLERALERADVAGRFADWPDRRRAPKLKADLARLGLEVDRSVDAPVLPSEVHMLGALYVLEGSKLGGRVLHRRQMASPDARVRAADGFLGHRHERGWSGFLTVLDAVPPEPDAWAGLRDGAELAFATFHAAARCDRPPQFRGGSDTLAPLSSSPCRGHG